MIEKSIIVESPILKIGAVVMREVVRHPSSAGSGGVLSVPVTGHLSSVTSFFILIIQTHPKHVGEIPPFVLPRGSRQYQLPDGSWHDARDAATGEKYRDTLEPFTRGLEREVAEEAGVTADMLARAQVHELGRLEFQSRTKGVYPIHWFVVTLAEADAAALDAQIAANHMPEDALSMQWATLDIIEEMAARGEFSAGYIPVIEAALTHAVGAA